MADPFLSLSQQFVSSKRVFVKSPLSPCAQVGQAASDYFIVVAACPSNMRFRSARNMAICARNYSGGIDFPFLWSCEYHTRRSREAADFRKSTLIAGAAPRYFALRVAQGEFDCDRH